jgi:hypothetical protein
MSNNFNKKNTRSYAKFIKINHLFTIIWHKHDQFLCFCSSSANHKHINNFCGRIFMTFKNKSTVLQPHVLCETRAGNLAHVVGRIAFLPGRPMLVEHIGGIYLEHTLCGTVITPGYGDEFSIVAVFDSANDLKDAVNDS